MLITFQHTSSITKSKTILTFHHSNQSIQQGKATTMRKPPFLLLSILSIVWYCGATIPKTLLCHDLLRIRGGQEIPEFQLQIGNEALSEGISIIVPDDPNSLAGRTFIASPTRTLGATLLQQFEFLRAKAYQLPDVATVKEQSSRIFIENLVPVTMALRDVFLPPIGGLSLPAVYILALLGASSGFYMFLYFITIGYAFGVMFPLVAALGIYNSQGKIPVLTNLHSGLTVAWAIRASTYFLHREYINWPQLHAKVVEVNKMAKMSSKMACWIIYSFFYVLMAIPCLSRLESGSSIPWGVGGKLALGLQVVGLVLEGLADYQKSTFKAIPGNRNQWCHVGLWKFSTHPNYLGESLFWYGTYFGGMSAFRTPAQWILASLGILFITVVMKGAVSSLGTKHVRKYSNNPEFVGFRKSHTLFGPNPLAQSF